MNYRIYLFLVLVMFDVNKSTNYLILKITPRTKY